MYNKHFSSVLIKWYDLHKRDLPWRDTKDPYIIWISEIILQQTRVEQGYDYFNRFITRYPNVQALAQSTEEEVLKYWQGLGYYSRARNLYKTARQISEKGTFPDSFDALKALSGVGDYTAAAIASFAYGEKVAVVDGNVYRVLSRYYGIPEAIDTTKGKKTFAALAHESLPRQELCSDYNQAIMDFGATQCQPRAAQCDTCPLQDSCYAYLHDMVYAFPVKSKRPSVKQRFINYLLLEVDGKTAFFRREGNDIWKGLYEPYLYETAEKVPVEETVRRISAFDFLRNTKYGSIGVIATDLHHQLTHRLITCNAYALKLSRRPSDAEFGRKAIWVDNTDITGLAVSRLVEQVLDHYFRSSVSQNETRQTHISHHQPT